jgi:PAS domain S-box-containing protein
MDHQTLSEQQRLELLYRISREISGRLHLDELVARLLKETAATIGMQTASLVVLDDQSQIVASALIVNGVFHPDPQHELADLLRNGLAGWVMTHRQPVLIIDSANDPRWTRRPDDDRVGPKSVISVPLQGRSRLAGILTLVRTPAGSFATPDLALMVAIAEQAGIAIENAGLFAESQRRAQAMRALAETAQAVNSTLDLDAVLQLVVHNALTLLRVETAAIALVNVDGTLTFREAVGRQADRLRGVVMQPGEGLVGWVASYNQHVIAADRPADERFTGGLNHRLQIAVRASAGAPVRVGQGVIGVIEVINPLESRFAVDTLPLLDSLASLAGTAIVHAQQVEELRAAESRFSGLFEDNIDPILITDLDGTITDANRKASEAFGYDKAELIGRRITAVHRTGTAFLGSDRYGQLHSGREITYQTAVVTKDGRELPVEVYAKRIERRGQEFIQWIQRDISERLQLEEMRNDLMSMIFHDLRGPLGNVISSLDMVAGSLPADLTMERAMLNIAQRSATRLSRLVDSLLDLRRLETGQMTLSYEQLDLRELADDVLEQVRPMAAVKTMILTHSVPDDLPLLLVDADMIRRVIINLTENAVKYTPSRGQVTLSATRDAQSVTVSVADTGPGIPDGEQSRIFDKFTRLQSDNGPKGLGLGLAFCRLAVEAHGGQIWVDPNPTGTGSVFSFSLPLQKVV